MSHILVIVSQRYNGDELFPALRTLIERGHTYKVVSTALVIADEVTAEPNTIETLIWDVPNMQGFDGLMIVSGNPKDTEKYWHDVKCRDLVVEANDRNLPIAAICAAVPAIRYAAKGKKVSFFPLIRSRVLLEEAGAQLETITLTTDANLVTAENEFATTWWAVNFCDLLDGKSPTYVLHPSPFKRKTRERKPIPELEHLKDVYRRTGKAGTK